MTELAKTIKIFHGESRLLKSRTLEAETIELEVRVGVIPGKTGTHDLWWHNAYNYCNENATEKKWSQYISKIVSISESAQHRMIQYKNQPEKWQNKLVSHKTTITDQWARVSLSSESPSQEPVHKGGITTRYISRHSFFIKNARIDLSRVYNDITKDVSKEIEIEYIFDKSKILIELSGRPALTTESTSSAATVASRKPSTISAPASCSS